MADSCNKLRIAITGGGLAGATLANALFKLPHLDVQIYESAPEFSERGAAVGLASNAQESLGHIVPSVQELLDRAGAVSMHTSRLMLGSGPLAGTKLMDIPANSQGRVVHRASLLRELLAPLPPEIMHTSKKLVAIDEVPNDGLILRFQNGTTSHTDGLIGADGIFGFVRQHILDEGDPAIKAVPAGWWDCRNLVPMEKAKEKLGAEYFEESRQYGWVGDGGFMLHDVLDDGLLVQCALCRIDDNPSSANFGERQISLTKEKLEKEFATWLASSTHARGMIDLFLEQEDLRGYSQYDHPNASTYSRGRACIMGDAAHAMTPWQGSGAAQAIEDAMILGVLLSAIKTPQQLDSVFKAYDHVRRPRTQQIVESSRMTGLIMSGKVDNVGLDPQKMTAALASRWDFIKNFDMNEHKKEALAALHSM